MPYLRVCIAYATRKSSVRKYILYTCKTRDSNNNKRDFEHQTMFDHFNVSGIFSANRVPEILGMMRKSAKGVDGIYKRLGHVPSVRHVFQV